MKHRFSANALLLAMIMLMSSLAMAQEQIKLVVNDATRIEITANTQVMVGNNEKLAIRLVTPTQLMIKGLAPGYTDIWLINDQPRRISVTIEAAVDTRLALQLDGLKQQDSGLLLSNDRNFVIARGKVLPATADALQQLSSSHAQLLNQTQLLPTDKPMLRLSVKILEIKRQHLQQLGIEWQSATTGPTAATAIKGVFNWSATIESTLNLLQQQGHAKLLAKPTLSAQSGESARFLAGGEVPIPQVLAQGMQDVTFREYGIKLDIAPQVTPTGKIKTTLSAEVSNLDPAVSVNGIPGILTRRTDSVFLAEEGSTLVLSGLMSLEKSSNESQMPGINSIPLIGALFESRELREQQTELLIMVTAERLDAAERRMKQQQKRQQQQRDWLLDAGCVGLQEVIGE